MDFLANTPPIVQAFLVTIVIGAVFAVLLANEAAKKGAVSPLLSMNKTDSTREETEFRSSVLAELKKLPILPEQQMEATRILTTLFEQEADKRVGEVKTELREAYEKTLQQAREQVKIVNQKYEDLNKNYKKLNIEKKQTETVVHAMAEGLIVVNQKGEILLMNPAAEKLLGVKKEDEIGKSILAEQKEERLITLMKGITGSEEKEIVLESQNDQTKKILRASNAIIESESGQTIGMVSVLSDVTREKELEDLKNKFVSSVSHELRTPLYTIQEAINLLLDKSLGSVTSGQERLLSLAAKEIERLSRLINDILDISKIEAGEFRLQLSLFCVNDWIQQVMDTFNYWAKSKQIILGAELPPEPLTLTADRDRMTQVLTNLIGNAMKFTPAGGKITVEAKTKKENSANAWIEIGVRDTGPGISKEDQEKIFKKFVQLDKTSTQGTGLGLTISKELVELHKGRIWVESEPDKGSRFAFEIPQHGGTSNG